MTKTIVNLLVILLPTVVLTTHSYFYPTIGDDNLGLLTVAKSYVDGNGFNIPYVENHDLSSVNFRAYFGHAAGYAVFFSAALLITGSTKSASVLLYALFALLFFSSWFKLYSLFKDSLAVDFRLLCIACFLLWTFSDIFTIVVADADFFALAAFSAAVYNFVFLWAKCHNLTRIQFACRFALLAVLSFMGVLFKFSYFALSFVLPILLVGRYYLNRYRFLKIAVMLSFLPFILIGLEVYLWPVSIISDKAGNFSIPSLNLAALLSYHNFILYPLNSTLPILRKIIPNPVIHLLLSSAIIGLVSFTIVGYIKKNKHSVYHSRDYVVAFFTAGVFWSLIHLLFLSTASLMYGIEWGVLTLLSQPRLFVPVYLFIVNACFISAFGKGKSVFYLKPLMSIFLIATLLTNLSYKLSDWYKEEGYDTVVLGNYKLMFNLDRFESYPIVFVTSAGYNHMYTSSIYAGGGIPINPETFFKSSCCSEPIHLFIAKPIEYSGPIQPVAKSYSRAEFFDHFWELQQFVEENKMGEFMLINQLWGNYQIYYRIYHGEGSALGALGDTIYGD